MNRPALKTPSKIGKPTGLPQAKSSSNVTTPSSSRAQTPTSLSMGETDDEELYKMPGPEPQGYVSPPDNFIIGDRVYVGGTKPGYIAYLGETQFAPGDWAGIVLDRPVGKNDGSVSGVRYFQCEQKRGVFARISKLTTEPMTPEQQTPSTPQAPIAKSNGMSTSMTTSMTGRLAKTSLGSSKRSLTGSTTHINKSPSSSSGNLTSPADPSKLRIGDRVLVSGSKVGFLKYKGPTDFAKGEWAGVELDEPQGKNDGSVAGKRYFACKPLYGLFAPIHKVTRGASSTKHRGSMSSLNKYSNLSRDVSESMESVSSIGSSVSSVSRSRVRLGITSLKEKTPRSTPSRPSTLGVNTTALLQKALKEKEEHIEQLLKERDMERSEIARVASQVDEAETRLADVTLERDRMAEESESQNQSCQSIIETLQREKDQLQGHLEEERSPEYDHCRKVEDLQFTIEEEAISKDDLEMKTSQESGKIQEIQDSLKKKKVPTATLR